MSETPYNPAELTDYAIEQSAQGEYAQGNFDLKQEDKINPALFDEMNARRNEAARDASDLAISGFESEQATVTPHYELLSGNEYLSGLASISLSLINTRNVELGIASTKHINPMPYAPRQYQQQTPAPSEPIIRRSYENPQDEYGLTA